MATTTIDPKNDTVMVYDSSHGDFGRASLNSLVASGVMAGTGVAFSIDPASGKTIINAPAGAPYVPPAPVNVQAGTGLTGGGTLSSDVTLNFDIAGLPAYTAIDMANDLVAVLDVSTGTIVHAPLSSISSSAYLPLSGGSVTGSITVTGGVTVAGAFEASSTALVAGALTVGTTINATGSITGASLSTAGMTHLGSFTALTIPAAAANVGAVAYATDINQIVYSDGINWRKLFKTRIYV